MYYLAQLIFWLSGWTLHPNRPPDALRCVMIAAPHTTNWDLIYARAAFYLMRIPVRFTIKREWLVFPLGLILKPMGAIGIDRRPKDDNEARLSSVQAMANLFTTHHDLCVLVTPEGSRSLRKEWRTGFYYTAKAAGVPIGLGYLDYEKKEAGVGMMVYPTDDLAADMRIIMGFYANIKGKYPATFSLDERFPIATNEK